MRLLPQSALLLALSSLSAAQTWTSCNPLNSTNCPLDTALGVANYTIDLTQNIMTSRVWNATAGKVQPSDAGALFTINQRGDSPTVQTNFYIFFGQVEVIMKAATGQGIVSSIVLESDDLDEVDWEWIGGNSTHVETNYFGKGNTTSYDRAIWYPVSNPQQEFHNYTVDWSAQKLDWYVDGQIVRTLPYAAANGGHNFPQTPCNVRLGIWAGGDPSMPNGTIEWAGGKTNYGDAPFTMTVKSVRISDASRGTQYQYGDETGSYQSIRILNNTAPIQLDGDNNGSASQTVTQKWSSLSKPAQIAIISSVCGVVGIFAAVFAFCCFKQRRAGRREKAIEDAKYEKQANELMAYRNDMARMRSQKSGGVSVVSSPVGNGPSPIGGPGNVMNMPVTSMIAAGGRGYQQIPQHQQPAQMMRGSNFGMNQGMGMGATMVPNPNPGYAYSGYTNSNYARSVSTLGTGNGRGYQRY